MVHVLGNHHKRTPKILSRRHHCTHQAIVQTLAHVIIGLAVFTWGQQGAEGPISLQISSMESSSGFARHHTDKTTPLTDWRSPL